EESEKEKPRTVEQVVRSRIIESWESQDEPEHLRTIRARILRNEERAGYLLELYQQIRMSEVESAIKADNTIEQSELLLSGLVARREGKLRIYNAIYQQVFNKNWVENELNNLRPYSESFRFWIASGGKDESRLLRGKALKSANKWAKDKNLSYQDKQFLAASREKEIQEKIAVEKQKARLERERKDREAAEKRNLVLSEANIKAKRRISIGSFVLILALVGATTIGISANKQKKQLDETKEEVVAVQELNKLAGKLQNKRNSSNDSITFDSTEALRLSALSFNIDNHQLKQALVSAASSQAHQQLEDSKKAKKEINKSKDFLDKADKKALDSSQGLQTKILFHNYQGNLLIQKKETQSAIEHYTKAFNILKNHLKKTDFTKDNQLLTAKNIESVHRDLLNLKSNLSQEFYQQVWNSLKEHFYARLENSLKSKDWRTADFTTDRLMLFIADREEERFLDIPQIENFSCDELKKMDSLWVNNSGGNFGFSVQKRIWVRTGNRLGVKIGDWNEEDRKNYMRFASAVGWYDENSKNNERESGWMNYDDYMDRVETVDPSMDPSMGGGGFRGGLPGWGGNPWVGGGEVWSSFLALRFVNCNI
ncbi:MAG: GUN4 domain-containing protein, partial [Cyanobacteria bacterium P01_D01_bin.116]